MRNISFALTTPQFLAGTKDVTRRMGWEKLKANEVLRAVEKAMGLKKGEEMKPLAMILTVDVRFERLDRMITEPAYGLDEVRREGFPDMTPEAFVEFFCDSHSGCFPERTIRRIEFKKLPLVRKEFAMHMRLQHGSTMGYNLFGSDGVKIGAHSSFVPRPRYAEKHPAKSVFTLYDPDDEKVQEFDDAGGFLVAYQRKLDAEASR